MTESVMDTKALPETLFKLITTEKVFVKETSEFILLTPIRENADCTVGLRGLFSDYPEMTVDKFLARKHEDKELE